MTETSTVYHRIAIYYTKLTRLTKSTQSSQTEESVGVSMGNTTTRPSPQWINNNVNLLN